MHDMFRVVVALDQELNTLYLPEAPYRTECVFSGCKLLSYWIRGKITTEVAAVECCREC